MNKQEARQDAAQRVVSKLHALGQLDDHLSPKWLNKATPMDVLQQMHRTGAGQGWVGL